MPRNSCNASKISSQNEFSRSPVASGYRVSLELSRVLLSEGAVDTSRRVHYAIQAIAAYSSIGLIELVYAVGFTSRLSDTGYLYVSPFVTVVVSRELRKQNSGWLL